MITNKDWGLLIIVPGLFLRRDLFDKELNLMFIRQNKLISYSIVIYMVVGAFVLLYLALSIDHPVYNFVDFKKLTYVYFLPAFILFAIYDYWLIKIYRNT
jgi:hypothetical protein